MDLRLHLLESFMAQGSDGQPYKVLAYERMARDESLRDDERWEPTGVLEFRLEDGRIVDARGDDDLRIAGSGVALTRLAGVAASGASPASAQARP